LIRDSADNSYHQFAWADNGTFVNSNVEGMISWGGLGNDFITGDHVSPQSSGDTIHGAQGNDQLLGRNGSDQLWGDEGDDLLRGGSGGDNLIGGYGSDRLYGGSGRDTLNGGGGNDVLRGGSGADRYHFSDGRDRVKGFSFSEGDRVVGAYEDVTAHRKGENLILASGDQVLVLMDVGALSVSQLFTSI
jgi:Ca2+-binding RTX toxin-like protein